MLEETLSSPSISRRAEVRALLVQHVGLQVEDKDDDRQPAARRLAAQPLAARPLAAAGRSATGRHWPLGHWPLGRTVWTRPDPEQRRYREQRASA